MPAAIAKTRNGENLEPWRWLAFAGNAPDVTALLAREPDDAVVGELDRFDERRCAERAV